MDNESQLGHKLSTLVDPIKQEAEELLCFDKKVGVLVSKTKPQPKPYGLLHEVGVGVPPFLTKTYEIVENPKTDEIISWGENGVSFVVWDNYKFSNHLLPNYFKHSNFSTFVRQLNTYGFRKVNLDRWEFANSAFQREKKHLLKSIKRKYHGGNKNSRLNFPRETEFEELKLEHETLKADIHDLKQEQLNSNHCLASMKERLESVEWKQKEFLLLIVKAMKRTPLFQQLLQKYGQKKAIENERLFKRRRLASGESLDDSYSKHLKQFSGIQPDENPFVASTPVGLGPHALEEQSSNLTSDTSGSDLSSGNYIMWEKLMEDDVICVDDDEETFDVDQTNFVHELEDLIGRPLPCGSLGNVGDEVGEVTCLGEQGNKTM